MRKLGILEDLIESLGYDPTELIRPHARPVTAYKLFRKKGEELHPLFVDADKGIRPGRNYLEASAGELTDKGKVKSKIGPLAYRPGWHAGDLPLATHIGGKSRPGLTAPDYRPDDQVWAEIMMPNRVDWQRIANDRAEVSKAGKPISRTAHITDTVPYQGHYRYKTNPNMTGEWLIGGDMKVNRLLDDAEVEEINARAGTADLPRLGKLALPGAVGLGALTDSEEAEALPKGKAARALMEEWGMTPEKIANAEAMGFNTDEVFWRGGPQTGGELPAGRAGGVYFSPQKEYADQYGEAMGGNTYPYLLREGNQFDPSRNPAHEQEMIDRFNAVGGWQKTQEYNYAFDEESLASRARQAVNRPEVGPGNPFEYNPKFDDQWEVLDEPETDIIYDIWEAGYDTTRHLERNKEGYEGIMVPNDQRHSFRRLDADFNPDMIDSKDILASAAPAAVGLGALAESNSSEASTGRPSGDEGFDLLSTPTGMLGALLANVPWSRGFEQLDLPQQGLFGLGALAETGDLSKAAQAAQGDPWEMAGELGGRIKGDSPSAAQGLVGDLMTWGIRLGSPF